MRSGEHELFDAYQATGADRAYVAARLRAFTRIGNVFRDIGVSARVAVEGLSRAVRALEAASLSANRSHHDPPESRMNTDDMETVGIEPTEGSRHTAPDRTSPLIGSLGNSSDGMVHLMLSRNRSGGSGVRLSLSHEGWNGHASLDGHSVARLEQLCAIALEALGERGYDLEKLRASAKYHGDVYIREGLAVRPPTTLGEDAA